MNYQTDTYHDFADPECVYMWLRIRDRYGKLKHWLPENEPVKIHCNETGHQLFGVQEMKKYLLIASRNLVLHRGRAINVLQKMY